MSESFNGAARVAPYNIKRAIENYEADSKAWKQHEWMLFERFIASFKDGVWKTQREKARSFIRNGYHDFSSWDHTPSIMAKRVGEDITQYNPYISKHGEVVWEKTYHEVKKLSSFVLRHCTNPKDIYLSPSQTEWVSIWQERHIEDLGVRQAYNESFYSQCIHSELVEERYYSMPKYKEVFFKGSDTLVASWFSVFGGELTLFDEGCLSFLQKWRVKRRIKKFLKEDK